MLLDDFSIREEKLIDMIYLTEGDSILKDDIHFAKAKQVLWLMPIEADESDIKDCLKQKTHL